MLVDYKYVWGTFEESDVVYRLEDDCMTEDILDYIKDNDLMDDVIMHAVEYMRDWFDWSCGDAMWDALNEGVKKATGKSIVDWECSEEDE